MSDVTGGGAVPCAAGAVALAQVPPDPLPFLFPVPLPFLFPVPLPAPPSLASPRSPSAIPVPIPLFFLIPIPPSPSPYSFPMPSGVPTLFHHPLPAPLPFPRESLGRESVAAQG